MLAKCLCAYLLAKRKHLVVRGAFFKAFHRAFYQAVGLLGSAYAGGVHHHRNGAKNCIVLEKAQ